MRSSIFIFLTFGFTCLGFSQTGIGTENPTETLHIQGEVRIENMPVDGETSVIFTTPEGTKSSTRDQDFNASKTVVVDSNGVLGTVDELPFHSYDKANVVCLVPSKIYALQDLELNLYLEEFAKNKRFGINDELFVHPEILNAKLFDRFIRINQNGPATKVLKTNVYNNGYKLITKDTEIPVADISAGSGMTRKIMVLGASKSTHISSRLKTIFDNDVMNAEFVGTQGGATYRHEARGGWSSLRYNSNFASYTKFYVLDLTSINVNLGDVYSNNGSEFEITELNNADNYFSAEIVSGSNEALQSGTLTITSGSGDLTIIYTNAEVDSANPFYNNGFDFSHYMSDTSQSMDSGDWVIIELGTNSLFSFSGDKELVMTQIVAEFAALQLIVSSIHTYNSNINIAIVTIPTTGGQDGYAATYGSIYQRESFIKNAWLPWNLLLIATYDNEASRSSNIELVPMHLFLDSKNDFKTRVENVDNENNTQITRQIDPVHLAEHGYDKMANAYYALIKNKE